MAKKKSTPKPTFYEVVFQGKPKVVRAFISGLILGSGSTATTFFSFTDGVFHEGKVEKLAEFIHIRAIDCHVIVDGPTSTLLKKLGKRVKNETGLEITSHRHIRSASVKLSFQTFAPRYNDEIVALIKNLPAGLKASGFKHYVRLDPSADGIEAYTPAHHYETNGEATISGRADLVIELKKKFGDFPLIQSEDVLLKLA